jgi:hypothetical protein
MRSIHLIIQVQFLLSGHDHRIKDETGGVPFGRKLR